MSRRFAPRRAEPNAAPTRPVLRITPEALYRAFHAARPIACADVVVFRPDGDAVLLLLRSREPARRQWWVPGGAIRKNETSIMAAHRIAEEEAGLKVAQPRFLGCKDLFFEEDPFGHGKGTHTVSLVFATSALGVRVRLDRHHEDYQWAEPREVLKDPAIHRYVKHFIDAAWQSRMPLGGE